MTEELRPGTRFGRFDLLQRIGRGGMATVWVARERAEKETDQRIVAIKAILADLADDQEFIAMFLDEGRLVQRIRHPNVVELYEVGQIDEVMYLAMEWVEGESLHTLIAEAGKRRPIPPEMAVRIMADVAGGLHAAHETRNDVGEPLGVVHRDVSPHNILIGTTGKVKLVDFGVAKAKERMSEATAAGQVKGKFGYMSPEQALARPVDRRSDIFSLGIVLFELTTGRRLFRGDNDAETLALVAHGEIPRPSSVEPRYPEALERIVMTALSRSRSGRFQTALEFQQALEEYLKGEHTVVAQGAIGSLLKRVLGERIEERRRKVRAMLQVLDGHGEPTLVSNDSPFMALDPEQASLVTGPSQTSAAWAGVVGRRGLRPISARVPLARDRARSVRLIGYALGAAGLLCAMVVAILYLIGPRSLPVGSGAGPGPSDGITVGNGAAPSAPAATVASSSAWGLTPEPASRAGGGEDSREELPTITVDSLEPERGAE